MYIRIFLIQYSLVCLEFTTTSTYLRNRLVFPTPASPNTMTFARGVLLALQKLIDCHHTSALSRIHGDVCAAIYKCRSCWQMCMVITWFTNPSVRLEKVFASSLKSLLCLLSKGVASSINGWSKHPVYGTVRRHQRKNNNNKNTFNTYSISNMN